MADASKPLARPDVVDDGREVMRRLLADGCVRLAPNASGTAVAGTVYLKAPGQYVLELAGVARHLGARGGAATEKLSGSGGSI